VNRSSFPKQVSKKGVRVVPVNIVPKGDFGRNPSKKDLAKAANVKKSRRGKSRKKSPRGVGKAQKGYGAARTK